MFIISGPLAVHGGFWNTIKSMRGERNGRVESGERHGDTKSKQNCRYQSIYSLRGFDLVYIWEEEIQVRRSYHRLNCVVIG